MNKEKFNTYLEILGKWGEPNLVGLINFFFIEWVLIFKGKNNETFCQLLEALDIDNQDIISHVAYILGRIGNKDAAPYLRKKIQGKELWGITVRSLGTALIRLQDPIGINFLKSRIADIHEHRDTRIGAAKALIRLNLRNVFEKKEKVDFGGDTMTPEWSHQLENLVNKLSK